MKNLWPLFAAVCLLATGCSRQNGFSTTGSFETGMGRFDTAFTGLIEKWDLPGGALAIVRDGRVMLARGYGFADIETGDPVQPESLFRIASLSKPITAVAVLKLVEAGRLDLDTAAFQILSDVLPPEGAEIDPRIDQITVRRLLMHSGGWDSEASFDPMFMAREIGENLGLDVPADCAAIIRYMLGQPLDFEPGSRYAYSNFGYCILGRVIEKVSGQPYTEYVRDHVLEPIGITRMTQGRTLVVERIPGEVHYYDPSGALTSYVFPGISGTTAWPDGGFYLEAMDAHGGWIASAVDLARFAAALEPFNPNAILEPDTLALMTSRPEPPLWEGSASYYGLGWRVRPAGDGFTIWHTGSLPGSSAILYRTSDGLIWAALFNSNPGTSGDAFLVDVITAMGRADLMGPAFWIGSFLLAAFIFVSAFVIVRRMRKRRADRVREQVETQPAFRR